MLTRTTLSVGQFKLHTTHSHWCVTPWGVHASTKVCGHRCIRFAVYGFSSSTSPRRLCLAVDNTAAIAICENPGVTARNKHFSDAVHYVRHEYDHGRIRLVFVTTDKQRADGFTKPLESAAFHKWRRHIISAHPPLDAARASRPSTP